MVLILNENLKEKKCLFFSLRIFFGIGIKSSMLIYQKLGLSQRKHKNILDLDPNSILVLENIIKKSFIIGLDLKRLIFNNISFIKSIKSYRGLRHFKNLPCRGQRTRSNAKTCKKITKTFSILKK